MVLDPDPLQSQAVNVEHTQTHPNQPQLLDLGSTVMKEWVPCDAKTLAARRKRSEARRLKLLTTSCSEIAEPLPKRVKGIPRNGLQHESKVVRDGAAERGLDSFMLAQCCQPDDGSFTCSTRVIAGEVLSMKGRCMDACTGQPQYAGTEREQGQTLDDSACSKGRSSAPCSDLLSPTHCVVSICGRTRKMEDAAIGVPSFFSLPSSGADQGSLLDTNTFDMYGVFDGHGGPQAAAICKEKMAGILAEDMSAAGDSSPLGWEASMKSCFQRLDDELCGICPHGSECPRDTNTTSSCREPLVPGSVGTTAVVAVVGGDYIVVGNCGDSRAVLSRGGQAVPLSFDHKASNPDEVARIEAAGGYVFYWQGHRVCGVLAMSRALGDSYLKPYVIGLPEVTVTTRSDDDEFLILASDGLWDVLSNEYVCSVVHKVLAGWSQYRRSFQHHQPLFGQDPKQCDPEQERFYSDNEGVQDSPCQVVAALLIKLALAKQSKDNISVVVVDLRRA